MKDTHGFQGTLRTDRNTSATTTGLQAHDTESARIQAAAMRDAEGEGVTEPTGNADATRKFSPSQGNDGGSPAVDNGQQDNLAVSSQVPVTTKVLGNFGHDLGSGTATSQGEKSLSAVMPANPAPRQPVGQAKSSKFENS